MQGRAALLTDFGWIWDSFEVDPGSILVPMWCIIGANFDMFNGKWSPSSFIIENC